MSLAKRLYWILPLMIVLAGIGLLFYENLKKVKEPPDEGISRELKLGESQLANAPAIFSKNDSYILSYFDDEKLIEKIYTKSWDLDSEQTHDIPFNKWSRVYNNGETLLYTDYYALYLGSTDKKISEIDDFFPLQNRVLFLDNHNMYRLEPNTLKTQKVLSLEEGQKRVFVEQIDSKTYILVYYPGRKGHLIKLYRADTQSEAKLVSENIYPISTTETFKDLSFDVNHNAFAVIFSTIQKQGGKTVNAQYYTYHPFKKKEAPAVKTLQAKDPFSGSQLEGWEDIELKLNGKEADILFASHGFTETTYSEAKASNIYRLHVSSSGQEITRISNTPNRSMQPMFIDKGTVLWLDVHGDEKQINLASNREVIIQKADNYTSGHFISAAGKSVGMLSYAFFTIFLTLMWYIWPFLFILLMMVVNNNALERGESWIMYLSLFIYTIPIVLLDDLLFTNKLLAAAPAYMSFQGSSWLYILGFGALAYLIMYLGTKSKEWGLVVRFTYFVGCHVLLLTFFIGPYLIQ
ncbi:hypothetical protein [Thalassobacillus pellis]|uniref:hypothetical protein n=1 Tax=Thalassobacillus pellis TaxID=748008 RepID=UPI00195F29FF|nr:hypothetical protein [Thalassobacillus pellis]MBM7551932.1 hypothetical protein [Thalassobacillus pellis]